VHFGKLDDELLKEFGIKQEVFFAEFDFDKLSDAAIKTKVTIDPINKYPATSRDLALVLDETVTFSEVENITKKTEKKLISDIELFDVYKNEEQLGADKKSYAVKFIFEDYEKTLKDKEVDKVMNKLIDAFGKNLGAQIRK
jgi:phenylalanyl-tRNA synthetase beta chain